MPQQLLQLPDTFPKESGMSAGADQMAELVVRVGSKSAQGIRPNNEDAFVVGLDSRLFLVADGMGGQERGEIASGMAADIIPRVVHQCLAANEPAEGVLDKALHEANAAICDAGKDQPEGRRMGTTAVLALHTGGKVYVTNLGDSRAYLVRGDQVELLTVDHSVAQALVACGALTAEEARSSPYQHVLHKFLGCMAMADHTEIKPFTPAPRDRLLLASDGLTNHITDEDLRVGARSFPDPQPWAEHLVELALQRGSRDNVTCVVVAFDARD
jgi:protein phosphatase